MEIMMDLEEMIERYAKYTDDVLIRDFLEELKQIKSDIRLAA